MVSREARRELVAGIEEERRRLADLAAVIAAGNDELAKRMAVAWRRFDVCQLVIRGLAQVVGGSRKREYQNMAAATGQNGGA
jgi:hypothetical protein